MQNQAVIPPAQWAMLSDEAGLRRIGERVRRLRRARGQRQIDVAREAGISSQTYNRFEKTGHCTLTTLFAVSRALGEFGNLKILAEGDVQ